MSIKLPEGFDSEFKDLEDFIIKITHRIWEERDIDSIRRYYCQNVKMHLPNDYQEGVENVVLSTLEMLNAFPNRRLLPEDIIPKQEKNNELYSSHRIMNVMQKTGDGLFGKANGKRVVIRGIADCLIRKAQVIEEWLIRDLSGLLTQLGIDFKDYAKKLALKNKNKVKKFHLMKCENFKENLLLDGSKASDYVQTLKNIWKGKLTEITNKYVAAVRSEVPNSRTLYGHEMLHQFYFGYLSSFSSVKFSIDHLAEESILGLPTKVAARWSVCAQHTGSGYFGAPSFAPIYILGISQAYLYQDKVICEWHLIDEVAVFEQIYLNLL